MDYGVIYTMTTPSGTVVFNRFTDPEVFVLQDIKGLDHSALRTTVEIEAQADGVEVFDAYGGQFAPTFEGVLVPIDVDSRERMRGSLVATLTGSKRADGTIVWTPPGALSRQLTFRLFEEPSVTGDVIKRFFFGLVGSGDTAAGALGTTLNEQDTSFVLSSASGWSFPFTFPFSFGGLGSGGTATVTNAGTSDTFPTIKVFSTLRQPIRIRNETTDKQISLPALDVVEPDFVQIDMKAQEVTLNGDASSSLFDEVDLDTSEFWTLQPDANLIRLTGSDPDANAKATIIWRDGL